MIKPYYETELGKLYHGDCLEILSQLDEKVDLVLTSPPYDNLRNYKGYSFDFEATAEALLANIKEGGVLVWIVGDATIDGSETGTSFTQALYFMNIGFKLHDTMIYAKKNPIPLTHNRYEQCFEYMFVFVKGNLNIFNPIKTDCLTQGEYTHRRNTGRVEESSTRNREEITVTKERKYLKNIWEYVIGSRKGETGIHPAPFPEKLAEDHIISWSNEQNIVLDIFSGSGTTAKMCEKNNRRWIGIEISKEYCDIAVERIKQERAQLKLL